MIYNWQQPGWPVFSYHPDEIGDMLLSFAEETGHISGVLKAMPEAMQTEAVLAVMVAEAVKTSAIEGEYISRPDVISSIRNNLGLDKARHKIKDKKAKGAGELMVEVRKNYALPLTQKMLFEWHKMLLADAAKIRTGAWRIHKEPMQVVSGAIGREKIHFEAPPSVSVPVEMKQFIRWFNDTAPGGKDELKKAPVRAALAHLYFESIHPFEDGNGRIGRAIAEKALSQTIGRPVLLSLSQIIEANKKAYYSALEKAQRSNEITPWIKYFVKVVLDAQLKTKDLIDFSLKKTKLFDRYKDQLNERQLKALRKMLESPDGFEGGMTSRKYISITRASKATAARDLQMLAELKILQEEGGGRSTRYVLGFEEKQ